MGVDGESAWTGYGRTSGRGRGVGVDVRVWTDKWTWTEGGCGRGVGVDGVRTGEWTWTGSGRGRRVGVDGGVDVGGVRTGGVGVDGDWVCEWTTGGRRVGVSTRLPPTEHTVPVPTTTVPSSAGGGTPLGTTLVDRGARPLPLPFFPCPSRRPTNGLSQAKKVRPLGLFQEVKAKL